MQLPVIPPPGYDFSTITDMKSIRFPTETLSQWSLRVEESCSVLVPTMYALLFITFFFF